MVIFDGNRTMLSASGNQFINPDYLRPLSPLPSELDAKSSPLALLAKTCSQIGAEPSLPNGKSFGKSTSSNSTKRHDPNNSKESKSVSPFNGYRSDSRGNTSQNDRQGSRSRSGSVEIKVTDSGTSHRERDETNKTRSSLSSNVSSMSAKSPTTFLTPPAAEDDQAEEEIERKRSSSPARSSTPTTPVPSSDINKSTPSKLSSNDPSPIIRSGLEVLTGHHTSSGSTNARDILLGAYRPQFPPSLGYPGFGGSSSFPSHLSANPFWASFMSNSGAVCRDPLCSDPFCPTAMRNQQLFAAATGRLSASSALSSYSSLFTAVQQREALLAAQRSAVALAAAAASTPPGTGGGPKPHVCSWVAGADYCGRRFSSSEELLVHLKTHTSDPRAGLPGLTTAGPSTTSPTLSSSSRFHPYARPLGTGVPPSLASSLPSSLGLPPGYPLSYASLYPSLFPRPPLL